MPSNQQISEQAPRSSVALTAVLIGTSLDGKAVEKVRTTFIRSEPIAITVRYQASEVVSRFPVGLGINLGNSMFGDRQYTQVADIARQGAGEHTFVVRPDEQWVSNQQLLQVSLDGVGVYSKMISVE